jgi:hypothetical protein
MSLIYDNKNKNKNKQRIEENQSGASSQSHM